MFFKNFFRRLWNGKHFPTSKIDYDYYFNTNQHGDISLSVQDLGNLNVMTGKIIACDPLAYLTNTVPLKKKILSGQYPVKIVIANSIDMGERYAFAKLEVNGNKTVKWELAMTQEMEDRVYDLKEGDYFGFPVDAGLACFCDQGTQQEYLEFMDEFQKSNPKGNIYDDYFASRFKKNAKDQSDSNDIGDWLNFQLPNSASNIIMFHSGFGDGYYPAYWGYDCNSKVSSLLIDFQIFGDE